LIIAAVWLTINLVKRQELLKWKIFGSIVTITFLFHPIITKRSLLILGCFEIAPGEYWLLDDLNEQCWEGDHLAYFQYVSIPSMLIWIIIFPMLCLIFLMRNK